MASPAVNEAAPGGAAVGVLYVDDERPNLDLFRRHFDDDLLVFTASSADEALELLEREAIGVVVSDQRMPGMTGVELLARASQRWPSISRVLLTAYSDREILLEAIQRGHVHDYVLKPYDTRDLGLRLRTALEEHQRASALERAAEERDRLRAELEERDGGHAMVGLDNGLRELAAVLDRIAQSGATVMIRGESGVGKELVAHELHRRSPRSGGPFVRVNCAAFAEGVLESELFGHEAGSFTGAGKGRAGRFEQANGGTLFLDEIGDVSAAVQVRLLRVLQERELERVGGNRTIRVDIRVIAATHKNLETEVKEGRFRHDLYHRLNVVPLTVPPLRARPDDIAALASHFVARFSAEMGKRLVLAPAALPALRAYDWPGNVRELRNVIERAAVLADRDAVIDADDLLFDFLGVPAGAAPAGAAASAARSGATPASAPAPHRSVFEEIAEGEAERIRDALRAAGGNKARAARALGLPRTTLNERIRKLGV